MVGWMDGWIDGWMDGWPDAWMGGWIDECMDGRLDEWTDGCMNFPFNHSGDLIYQHQAFGVKGALEGLWMNHRCSPGNVPGGRPLWSRTPP